MERHYRVLLIVLMYVSTFIPGCVDDCTPEAVFYVQDEIDRLPEINMPSVIQTDSEGFPVAGIVSHHMLAGKLIDNWFRILSGKRDVNVFFIVSPRHWGLGVEDYSLTSGSWKTSEGIVTSCSKTIRKLSDTLDINTEPEVFYQEHGVSTFMPFIKKYFPEAQVVVLAMNGEGPIIPELYERLFLVLKKYFTKTKYTENFLLVSADFSHNAGLAETRKRDKISMQFIVTPGNTNWFFTYCDNKPGMYLFKKVFKTLEGPYTRTLYNTNSYHITGFGEEDITSYFFTFMHMHRSPLR